MKLFLKIFVVLIILSVFAGTIIFLYQKSQKKPVFYKTANPFKTDIIKKTVAVGAILPRKEIEIKPQVSGIIEKIFVEAGIVKKASEAGMPAGTVIEVRNLFFNTPARKKFLKTEQTEFSHIADFISKIALSFPQVQM